MGGRRPGRPPPPGPLSPCLCIHISPSALYCFANPHSYCHRCCIPPPPSRHPPPHQLKHYAAASRLVCYSLSATASRLLCYSHSAPMLPPLDYSLSATAPRLLCYSLLATASRLIATGSPHSLPWIAAPSSQTLQQPHTRVRARTNWSASPPSTKPTNLHPPNRHTPQHPPY